MWCLTHAFGEKYTDSEGHAVFGLGSEPDLRPGPWC